MKAYDEIDRECELVLKSLLNGDENALRVTLDGLYKIRQLCEHMSAVADITGDVS